MIGNSTRNEGEAHCDIIVTDHEFQEGDIGIVTNFLPAAFGIADNNNKGGSAFGDVGRGCKTGDRSKPPSLPFPRR